jgi:hypothetical protein
VLLRGRQARSNGLPDGVPPPTRSKVVSMSIVSGNNYLQTIVSTCLLRLHRQRHFRTSYRRSLGFLQQHQSLFTWRFFHFIRKFQVDDKLCRAFASSLQGHSNNLPYPSLFRNAEKEGKTRTIRYRRRQRCLHTNYQLPETFCIFFSCFFV